MSEGPDNFESSYSDSGYWQKLKDFGLTAGKAVVEKSLWLYYAAQRPETPVWAKTVVYGALGYFILPTDAIPDFTPIVGYSDDLGAITVAVATIAAFINDEVKAKARQKLQQWFG